MSKKMIVSYLKISVPLERQQRIMDTLQYVKSGIQVQSRFNKYDAYKNLNNSDELIIIGKWKSREDLFKHIQSKDYKAILAVMEMSCELPEIRFNSVSSMGGLDFINEIRGNKKTRMKPCVNNK